MLFGVETPNSEMRCGCSGSVPYSFGAIYNDVSAILFFVCKVLLSLGTSVTLRISDALSVLNTLCFYSGSYVTLNIYQVLCVR